MNLLFNRQNVSHDSSSPYLRPHLSFNVTLRPVSPTSSFKLLRLWSQVLST